MLATSAFVLNSRRSSWTWAPRRPAEQIPAPIKPDLAHLTAHPRTTIQDKFRQKVCLQSHSVSVAPFLDLVEPAIHAIKDAAARLGLPLMLKSKTLA